MHQLSGFKMDDTVRGRSRAIGSCEANNYCVSIKELPLTVVHLVHANPFLSSLVVWGFAARPHNTGHMTPNILCELYIHHDYYSHIKHMCSCLGFFFFFFFFSIRLWSVLHCHSFFSSPPQRPYDLRLWRISIPEYGMARSLTGDWTRDVPHSMPALYH